jgi:type II secretion system protein G
MNLSPSDSPGRQQRGFTLIEIMVVVIIIGLLAAVVVPQFLGRVDDARIAKAKQDIQALETGLTMYKLDNFTYPTGEEGLKALVEKPNDPNVKNWRRRRLSQALAEGSMGQRLPVPVSRHARRSRRVLTSARMASRR